MNTEATGKITRPAFNDGSAVPVRSTSPDSLTNKTAKRKGVSKSAATHYDAKRKLQDLIDQHEAGGSEVLEARDMTFAILAQHSKETRYCEAFYDEQGRKLYGVREPKNRTSMINRLVSLLAHLKLIVGPTWSNRCTKI